MRGHRLRLAPADPCRWREQIERVEASSDAYHLSLGEDVMVACLLEVTRKR